MKVLPAVVRMIDTYETLKGENPQTFSLHPDDWTQLHAELEQDAHYGANGPMCSHDIPLSRFLIHGIPVVRNRAVERL